LKHKDKILVTGSTGFVGLQVLKHLQKRDIEIVLVSRPGWQDRIKCQEKIVDVIETEDLFSKSSEWWEKACKKVNTIAHLAWYAESGKYLSSEKNIDCIQGTLYMAKGAVQAGVSKFVGIGTCFEYDLSYGFLSENTPLKPETLYASTKAATYLTLLQLFSQQEVNFSWCRLFYLYGKNENPKRLASYIRSKLEKNQIVELTSGNQIRDFMDVADAGIMIANIICGSKPGVFNICSGIPITVKQFAEDIADEYDSRNLLHFGTRPDNACDPPCVVGRCSTKTKR
jgi:nucleoside-diphosphate-sugar epimerase